LPQQLFGWRRQLRESEAGGTEADGLQFVPAVVDAGSSAVARQKALRGKAEVSAGTIEVEIAGVVSTSIAIPSSTPGPISSPRLPDMIRTMETLT
jgi:transposase